jgi:hypothetical protein
MSGYNSFTESKQKAKEGFNYNEYNDLHDASNLAIE